MAFIYIDLRVSTSTHMRDPPGVAASVSNKTWSRMPCQICRAPTRAVLTKEQNISCGDYFEERRLYPEDRGALRLMECVSCGFARFDDIDRWSAEEFHTHIYNADYHLCDPPFLGARPRKLAAWLASALPPQMLVDYGGGEGMMADLLRASGFDAVSFDPFYGDGASPVGASPVVTAFEVVEHAPDQRGLFRTLMELCVPSGIIIFSTLLKPAQLQGDWWYACARNGHVSFHSEASLQLLMAEFGLSWLSLSPEMHVAARDAHLLGITAGWPAIAVNDAPSTAYAAL